MYTYSFGVPNELIWSSHILMGIFFVYIGYELIMRKKIPEYLSLTIVVLGAVGGLYHLHLWYDDLKRQKKRSAKQESVKQGSTK
jgi:uncharacterized membrane protein YfcA